MKFLTEPAVAVIAEASTFRTLLTVLEAKSKACQVLAIFTPLAFFQRAWPQLNVLQSLGLV